MARDTQISGRRTEPVLMTLLILALAVTAEATDYYVDGTNGLDKPARGTMVEPWKTINYALDHINGSADAPHRVLVAQAIYRETVVCDAYESLYGGYDPQTWARDMSRFTTTISGSDTDSCVILAEGSTVDGFVLSNGYNDYGGAVRCENVDATISNCRITLNKAEENGSAIYIKGGYVSIRNNAITNNTGSAVYVVDGAAGLENNIISDMVGEGSVWGDRTAYGIVAERATLTMSGDRVLRNPGRGIDLLPQSVLHATRCIIGENGASGISIEGEATITECLFHGNNASDEYWSTDHNGGGIAATHVSSVTVERTIFCQNFARKRGGAVYRSGGGYDNPLTILDSIFVANHTNEWEQGCYLAGAATSLKNNFFVNNGILVIGEGWDRSTPFVSVNNSVLFNEGGYCAWSRRAGDITMTNDILWGNTDDVEFLGEWNSPVVEDQLISYCNIEDGDLNGQDGSISVNPDFVGEIGSGTLMKLDYKPQDCRTVITDNDANHAPDALARCFLWVEEVAFYVESNTANTITVFGDVTQAASEGYSYSVQDYHLMEGSLCIDAGTGTGALDHDFEGQPRPSHGGVSMQVDMGADEFSDAMLPNDPPTQPEAVVAPAVVLTVPSIDPEGKATTYTVRWESNAGDMVVHADCVNVRGTLCDVLTETELLAPQKSWTVTVTPSDGRENGPSTVVEIPATQ